jgi:hypothetical protein
MHFIESKSLIRFDNSWYKIYDIHLISNYEQLLIINILRHFTQFYAIFHSIIRRKFLNCTFIVAMQERDQIKT